MYEWTKRHKIVRLDDRERVPQEVAAHRRVCNIGIGAMVKYVVEWNNYIPSDDTVELPNNNAEHFITCFGDEY